MQHLVIFDCLYIFCFTFLLQLVVFWLKKRATVFCLSFFLQKKEETLLHSYNKVYSKHHILHIFLWVKRFYFHHLGLAFVITIVEGGQARRNQRNLTFTLYSSVRGGFCVIVYSLGVPLHCRISC